MELNTPDTAKGKRLEARALRAEAIRLLGCADRLDWLADQQSERKGD